MLIALTGPVAAEPLKLFDTHLHFNASHSKDWQPQQVIEILDRNNVRHAAITSSPTELVIELSQKYPDRILPVLGVYQNYEDKERWQRDKALPGRIERYLKDHRWYAIGELHLFAQERYSPVFESILSLATGHQIPLIMHSDPVVIDRIYELEPSAAIIWAHAGAYPYPTLIRNYLQRYPGLMIDLSMRNERIAPWGELAEEWELLFLEHPDRFMVGVDTFSSQRWLSFDRVTQETQDWLAQLPEDIASQIAFDNAANLFGIRTD
jgi:predicted TIM-barrel fold metal-dependent hydrolase